MLSDCPSALQMSDDNPCLGPEGRESSIFLAILYPGRSFCQGEPIWNWGWRVDGKGGNGSWLSISKLSQITVASFFSEPLGLFPETLNKGCIFIAVSSFACFSR